MSGVVEIPLRGKRGKGLVTKVDRDTADFLSSISWYLSDTGYAMNKSRGRIMRMHRVIMNPDEGLVVDHLNGDRLDNRRSNLRVTTQAENCRNRKDTRGVCFDKSRGKWMTSYRGKFYGRYDTEREALAAYQLAKSGVEYKKTRRKRYMLPDGVSFYKGYKKPFVARPTLNGVRHFLGYFATVEEAKAAYDNFWQKEK